MCTSFKENKLSREFLAEVKEAWPSFNSMIPRNSNYLVGCQVKDADLSGGDWGITDIEMNAKDEIVISWQSNHSFGWDETETLADDMAQETINDVGMYNSKTSDWNADELGWECTHFFETIATTKSDNVRQVCKDLFNQVEKASEDLKEWHVEVNDSLNTLFDEDEVTQDDVDQF